MANKQCILVIEDEKNIGNYIETILDSNGYKVLRAMNGMTGLSLCTSHFPEVILLDLGLPDLDGMEVLQKIRGFSDLPIIVISARTQEKEKVEAFWSRGASGKDSDCPPAPASCRPVLHAGADLFQRWAGD